jgi:hypothetical protein
MGEVVGKIANSPDDDNSASKTEDIHIEYRRGGIKVVDKIQISDSEIKENIFIVHFPHSTNKWSESKQGVVEGTVRMSCRIIPVESSRDYPPELNKTRDCIDSSMKEVNKIKSTKFDHFENEKEIQKNNFFESENLILNISNSKKIGDQMRENQLTSNLNCSYQETIENPSILNTFTENKKIACLVANSSKDEDNPSCISPTYKSGRIISTVLEQNIILNTKDNQNHFPNREDCWISQRDTNSKCPQSLLENQQNSLLDSRVETQADLTFRNKLDYHKGVRFDDSVGFVYDEFQPNAKPESDIKLGTILKPSNDPSTKLSLIKAKIKAITIRNKKQSARVLNRNLLQTVLAKRNLELILKRLINSFNLVLSRPLFDSLFINEKKIDKQEITQLFGLSKNEASILQLNNQIRRHFVHEHPLRGYIRATNFHSLEVSGIIEEYYSHLKYDLMHLSDQNEIKSAQILMQEIKPMHGVLFCASRLSRLNLIELRKVKDNLILGKIRLKDIKSQKVTDCPPKLVEAKFLTLFSFENFKYMLLKNLKSNELHLNALQISDLIWREYQFYISHQHIIRVILEPIMIIGLTFKSEIGYGLVISY